MKVNADWLKDAQWGAFSHYLGSNQDADEWNRQVDAFDVDGLAAQLASAGVPYYFLTIGQNSGHYCAPNETYDSIVGKPGFCSRRDLITDLSDALSKYGIKMFAYLPSGAPAADIEAAEKFGWEWGFEGGWPQGWGIRTNKRLAEFQRRWEAVIREWSLRFADKIHGWWIDGCYFADEMYRHDDAPNFSSLAAALRAGNPQSLLAFNCGQDMVVAMDENEDYTAGELSTHFIVPTARFVKDEQFHVLSYLGKWWGGGEPRFPDEFVVGYTKAVNAHEGVVTWDIPILPNGMIPETFIRQLALLKK